MDDPTAGDRVGGQCFDTGVEFLVEESVVSAVESVESALENKAVKFSATVADMGADAFADAKRKPKAEPFQYEAKFFTDRTPDGFVAKGVLKCAKKFCHGIESFQRKAVDRISTVSEAVQEGLNPNETLKVDKLREGGFRDTTLKCANKTAKVAGETVYRAHIIFEETAKYTSGYYPARKTAQLGAKLIRTALSNVPGGDYVPQGDAFRACSIAKDMMTHALFRLGDGVLQSTAHHTYIVTQHKFGEGTAQIITSLVSTGLYSAGVYQRIEMVKQDMDVGNFKPSGRAVVKGVMSGVSS